MCKPTGDYQGHDAGIADESSLLIAVKNSLHQPRAGSRRAEAWVARPGYLDDRSAPQVQSGVTRQAKKVEAAGCDVLPHLPRRDLEPSTPKRVEQLGVYQMYLTRSRRCRVGCDPGAALDAPAERLRAPLVVRGILPA